MDAVGEVLAQRENERFPWATGASLAILLHAAVGAGLILSSLDDAPRFVPGRTLMVRLQSASSLKGHAVDLAPVPAPAAAPEPEKPKILKPPDEVPPPPSEKAKLLPAKETPKTNPPLPAYSDPKGKGKTPATARPEKPAAASAGTGAAGAGTEAGPGTGVGVGGLKFDQPGFNYPYYYERVKVAIETNWFKPGTTMPTSPVVHFTIQRDGTITDAELVTSSGLPYVDRAAMRAVMAASPLPPLPSEFQSSHVSLSVLFE
ncbi:MAG TPA: TonB family protein [Thermoanaerobaculia bacterium]